jgi:PAS domain S-box-containing protein
MKALQDPYEILLTEDSPADTAMVREALQQHGVACELHVARDGAQAIGFIRDRCHPGTKRARLDLVLLDMDLPKDDGDGILTALRSAEGFAHTPVIVMGPPHLPEVPEQPAGTGGLHYFSKPSTQAQFLRLGGVVKEILASSQAGAGSDGPNGSVLQIATTRDAPERGAAEQDAKLLAAIVDSSDDAIISKDLNGIITSWNKGAERLYGYTSAEAVGQSIMLLIPADRANEDAGILSRIKRGERIDHFETVRRRKDGTLLDVSLTISPVKDAQERIIGASKIARDISGRKRAEEALIASEARFRQLADAMPQIVWTARPDGSVDYCNEKWYAFTGFDRDGQEKIPWEPILHPGDAAPVQDAWRACIRSGEAFQAECRLWDRVEARWRWFVGRALSVRGSGGQVTKWFGTWTDIDEQKRAEEELRRANQDLEQFAYSASHDLQEPLRSIKIFGELLAKRFGHKLDGQALEFLEYLSAGATRMEVLVRDLLAYTQVARLEFPAEKTGGNSALQAALENLAGAISESRASVTFDALPPLRVHSAHLQQLFQNLIGNAIKYRSSDRAPAIHVSASWQQESCVISVQDNGIGIEPEHKEYIFGLFKRLHAHNEYSGTGIGLAICQRIVERYHGRIWVQSEPGRGSTFFFSLPS